MHPISRPSALARGFFPDHGLTATLTMTAPVRGHVATAEPTRSHEGALMNATRQGNGNQDRSKERYRTVHGPDASPRPRTFRLASLRVFWLIAALFAISPAGAVETKQSIKDALVKIYSTTSAPDYRRPWTNRSPARTNGSGAVISGNRIVTNAHVVSYAMFVQVRRNGQGRRYKARVLDVVHDADLALLTVDEPGFFDGIEPIPFGELPPAQSDVLVYGFPKGGDALSVTKGVVSRIENSIYLHSGLNLLAGQVDAAINPGNSGGPVIRDGKLVGIVMQNAPRAQSQGYMVPVNVVNRVFKDLDDGVYQGFPALGVRLQNLENPALRAEAGLEKPGIGALVVDVPETANAAGKLFAGDVILEIEGNVIGDDGKFAFRGDERTSWRMLVQQLQIGESVNITVWRNRQRVSVSVPLVHDLHANRRIPNLRRNHKPRFYIHAGLVFAPVTANLLTEFGANWRKAAPSQLVHLMKYDNEPSEAVREWVVLQNVLPGDANVGYHSARYILIDSVNGTAVRDLNHLVELIETGTSPRVVLATNRGYQIVLDRAQARREHQALLQRYRIRTDRSL